jgi:hypothetical protein
MFALACADAALAALGLRAAPPKPTDAVTPDWPDAATADFTAARSAASILRPSESPGTTAATSDYDAVR